MTFPSYNIPGQDYIFRALTTARSSNFGNPPYGALGGNPDLVSTATAGVVSTAAITITAPTTITAGNLLVACLVSTTNGATYTPPAGWTQVTTLSATGVAFVYTKVATGSEPANYTFTCSSAAAQRGAILNYSNAGGIFFTNTASFGGGNVTTTVYPNSRLFHLYFLGNNNASGFGVSSWFNALISSAADPGTLLATSNFLYDVTSPTDTVSTVTVSGTSSANLITGVVLPKEQITYLDVSSVTAAVTTTAWQTTTRTVLTGKANTTLYVDSGDIQLSTDNTNWSNYIAVSPGNTVYIRSRVVDSNNLVAGIQTLNVYCNNDDIVFRYILDANIQMTTTNLSSATALSYTYEPAGRVVTLVGTDTITVSGSGLISTGQIRKNSTGSWGTSVSVVSGDTLNYRIQSSATRDTTSTATITSARSGALFTVSAVTTSHQVYNTAGTTSFTVPLGVTSICMACIGGGGGGVGTSATTAGGGGGGGALAYTNNVAVTSGETLTATRGAGGPYSTGDAKATDAGITTISRGATVLVGAAGGAGANGVSGGSGGSLAGSTGTVKFSGGNGAAGISATLQGGGGGGAATQAANGTAGSTASAGVGGTGGNGLVGAGASGTWTVNTLTTNTGKPGTGGGSYGGGGAGGVGDGTNTSTGGNGANGQIVMIWNGRTFSSAGTF